MTASPLDEAKLPGGYLVTPRVPQGLAAAVEGLTREVIRHSPEDIYVFAAHHFEKLLSIREQCGGGSEVKKKPWSNNENIRTLGDMSRALRSREIDRANARTTKRNVIDQAGWSLNQTAKVLKRHRSIFGDEGRRITTDQVFLMSTSHKENLDSPKVSSREACQEKRGNKEKVGKSRDVWKASTSRTDRSLSNEESTDLNVPDRTKAGPKIMTQIPNLPRGTAMLAKDIKSELRKNRMSSRERRTAKTKPRQDESSPRMEKIEKSSKSTSWKKSGEKHKKMESEDRDRRADLSVEQHSRSMTKGKTASMDRVKDYVMHKFATSTSLEELQSANYVEKVQEIVDETGPIIREKVEELKSGIIGKSKNNSWIVEETRKNRSRRSNGSLSDKRDSPEENSSPKDSSNQDATSERSSEDALRTKLTETQNLLENLAAGLTRPRRSRSARNLHVRSANSETRTVEEYSKEFTEISHIGNRDVLETRLSKTRDLLKDISSSLSRPIRRANSAKNLGKYWETVDANGDGTKDALIKRLDETRNLLKGVSASFGERNRTKSAKESSKMEKKIEDEETSLPDFQASSIVSFPAVKSLSVKNSPESSTKSDLDNLVLPTISPEVPKSPKIKEDLVLPILSPSGTASNENSNPTLELNEDDAFIQDEIDCSEIPGENFIPEVPTVNLSRDSLNVTPDFDAVPQRPDSLEPPEVTDGLEAKIPEVVDMPPGSSNTDSSQAGKSPKSVSNNKIEAPEKIDAKKESLAVDDSAVSPAIDNIEKRLEEIENVERGIAGALELTDPKGSEDSLTKKKLLEVEAMEKRIEQIFLSAENRTESKNSAEIPESTGDEIDESESSKEILEERMNIEKMNETTDIKKNESKDSSSGEKSRNLSPEMASNTYILTEGSPYEIPDTVTTVIIPDREIESPISERITVELVGPVETSRPLNPADQVNGNLTTKDNEVKKRQVPSDNIKPDVSPENDKKMVKVESSTKNIALKEQSIETPKEDSNPFGEIVEPEFDPETSADMEYIRELESMQEMPRQDLGRIKEEIPEDLEGLEDRHGDDRGVAKVPQEPKEERHKSPKSPEESNATTTEDIRKRDEKEAEGYDDETKESDLSPEGPRHDIDSESSNEAKESSAADETLESGKRKKCPGGLDVQEDEEEEEESSESRSPESSNEVKETTLTDGGFSLTLDPTRPFVPELNLDSLQDITISSFKMTEEDEYENEERGQSANTNSITDTLTSDENHHRAMDNPEFGEQIHSQNLSSSSKSKLEDVNEATESKKEEIVEETCVESWVEIKEDICEETITYVTGIECDEKDIKEEGKSLLEIEKNHEKTDAETSEKLVNAKEEKSPELEADQSKEKKEIDEENNPNEKRNPVEAEVEENKQSPKSIASNEKEETSNEAKRSDSKENVETVKNVTDKTATKNNEESSSLSNQEKIDSDNDKTEKNYEELTKNIELKKDEEIPDRKKVIEEVQNGEVDDQNVTKVPMAEVAEPASSLSGEKLEVDNCTEKEEKKLFIDETLEKSSPQRAENIDKDTETKLLNSAVKSLEKSPKTTIESSPEVNKSGNSSDEVQPGVDDESDDILDGEDDPPLAVSRSASQCTTRRVSSGNLAKLRQDPTLGWTEEIEREDSDDPTSSKVKFLGISDETIDQRGSEKVDKSSTESANGSDDGTNGNRTKDSKEYHIYVPEVSASADYSTTESSTFDSAVTKIQAGVRGFLTRRRLHRGQQKRSSTLSSIPSIQDSVAVEPYWPEDRESKAADDEKSRKSDEEIKVPGPQDSARNALLTVEAVTLIQSNYRGYNVRKRLRREDAVQRSTLSMEKSFGEGGLQHTGEFHDCIPLPIHDLDLKTNATTAERTKTENVSSSEEKTADTRKEEENLEWIDANMEADGTSILGGKTWPIGPKDKILFGSTSNMEIFQFGMTPSVPELVDVVVLAKDDPALQNEYLNFITSVEDAEGIIVDRPAMPMNLTIFEGNESMKSSESSREPLVLVGPLPRATIEEVTSSGAEKFMKADEDNDRTSANSSLLPGEMIDESVAAAQIAPYASSESISASIEGRQDKSSDSRQSETDDSATGTPETKNGADERLEDPEKKSTQGLESAVGLHTESGEMSATEPEKLSEDLIVLKTLLSFREENEFGPETSVDSIESPIGGNDEKNSSSGKIDLLVSTTKQVSGKIPPDDNFQKKDSLKPAAIEDTVEKDVSMDCSNAEELSSMLSFSMKVEDFLSLGSEDVIDLHGKKPILEVKLTSGDVMKSMNMSQDSQLAGDRIESPITMIQIAPQRSESIHQEEISDRSDENTSPSGKNLPSPGSAKSEKK